ncbi:MAG: GreA/GreB family elongation factor [Thermomicrobiales bacterium]|nr:GreA/GreB family elongation factor [Thermomicrobiales bacterium]
MPREVLLIATTSGKFHMMDCVWASEITNSYFYLRVEDVMADGIPACRTCKPKKYQPDLLRAVPPSVISDAVRKMELRRQALELFHSIDAQPSNVTVRFSNGVVESFQIVPDRDGVNRISVTSSFARAILTAEAGDIVRYQTPGGGYEEVAAICSIRDR